MALIRLLKHLSRGGSTALLPDLTTKPDQEEREEGDQGKEESRHVLPQDVAIEDRHEPPPTAGARSAAPSDGPPASDTLRQASVAGS